MKVLRLCPQCSPEHGIRYLSVDVREDDVYKLRCPEGHQTYSTHAEDKFELLGSLAMQAFVDGYYLQSISTFSASLERCFEWFLRVYYWSKFGDETLFEGIIKSDSKLSERQLGMYIAIYSVEFGARPRLLPKGSVELRNKIVHQGIIPTEQEAKDFAEIVIKIVNELVSDTVNRFKEASDQVRLGKASRARKLIGSDEGAIYYGYLMSPYRQLGGGAIRIFEEIASQFRYVRDTERTAEIVPSAKWIP